MDSRFSRFGAIFICMVMIAIPFVVVTFPPITDLPQQTAQIRLFLETLHNPDAPYRIQWLTPYTLSYAVLGAAWGIFSPLAAGKWAMLIIGIMWVIAIHALAANRKRSSAAAILACCFFFNHVVYWGFYSFAVGFPVFALWFVLVERLRTRSGLGDLAQLFLAAILLYLSHVLWFMAGMAYLVCFLLAFRVDVGRSLKALAAVVPAVLAVLIWYPTLSGSSMATPPLWGTNPLERLLPENFTDAALGGIYGPAEYVVLAAAICWIAAGLWQSRKSLKEEIDYPLLLCGVLFLGFALILPDKFMNTIRFAQRWASPALICLLLASPAPKLSPALKKFVVIALLAVFCFAVATTWKAFEREELSGLDATLAALPEKPRVIGLSMIEHNAYVKGSPFIQVFAYSQVLKGGTLNFSFAEFSPCLVVYKDFRPQWTNGLEWFPRLAQESDLQFFDHLIYAGTDEMHANIARRPSLTPVTEGGRWRLYKINPASTQKE
jgi:hypothetical protein